MNHPTVKVVRLSPSHPWKHCDPDIIWGCLVAGYEVRTVKPDSKEAEEADAQ
jgi:hypothetical protein